MSVVVLTANPAIDITYRLPEERPGETNRVREVTRRAGGKGLNVARVLGTLGVPAASVLPLGGDAGRWMRDELEHDDGVGAVHAVPIAGATRSTVAVVADTGHPTMYVEPGPSLTPEEWDAVTGEVAAACRDARWLVVSGSLPAGADPELVADWVRAAHGAGARVLVDCSGPALIAAARAGADILKPNGEELLQATDAADLDEGVRRLRGLGARTVVVSRGADGLIALEDAGDADAGATDAGAASVADAPVADASVADASAGNGVPDTARRHVVPAVAGVTGNPTGAGDAATAGLIAALVAGHPLATALRWASAAGAAAVRQPIAGTVDPDDVAAGLRSLGAGAPDAAPAG